MTKKEKRRMQALTEALKSLLVAVTEGDNEDVAGAVQKARNTLQVWAW